MKYVNSFLFLFVFILSLSAQSDYNFSKSFEWDTKLILIDPETNQLEKAHTIIDGHTKGDHYEVPVYSSFIKLDKNYQADFMVNVTKSSPIDIQTSEAKSVIKPQIDIWHRVEKRRNEYYLVYGFIPVIGTENNYQKVEEVRISYTLSPSKSTLRGGPTFASNSVLSDGKIYKVAIDQTGVYRVTYDYLNSLGVDVNNINPKNISIYTNNGRPAPENLIDTRQDDLIESAVLAKGEEDGILNSEDYFLFYAEGPESWSNTNNQYKFYKNIYSNVNYAYIKIGSSEGKRIAPNSTPNSVEYSTNIYHDLQRYEIDKVNLLGDFSATQGTGQLWFGDRFNTVREYNYKDEFDLSGYNNEEPLDISVGFAARCKSISRVYLDIDNDSYEETLSSIGTNKPSTDTYARYDILNATPTLSNANTDIVLRYPFQGTSTVCEGWLDYLQIIVPKTTNYNGTPILISNKNTKDYATASIGITGNPQHIWEVSDLATVSQQNITNNSINFNTEGVIKMFFAFDENDALTPTAIGEIPNQNLHATPSADMLIVYHPDFESDIERFVDHRSTHSNLTIQAIDVQQVYNEFSGGKVDPTAIRDLTKMMYDRYPNFEYLMLVGDGSYDFRSLTPNAANQNFIPVYETKESFNPISGFPTDDYYALLDLNEGTNLIGQLDIAVGRVPVKTPEDFTNTVNKIIHYDTSKDTYGPWRLNLGFAADDEDGNLHLSQTERIATNTEEKYNQYNQQKIYLDAFVQESTPGGARYPDATKAINNNIFRGMLVLNYLGHGGPKGWSQERVLQVSDVQNWSNTNKMPLLITATCSFTGYDEPTVESAGELAFSNPDAGAIALFSTVRAVFASDNERLVSEVYDTIFSRVNGEDQTLGKIITNSKNNNAQDTLRINARKFTLIGDPSMKLAIPNLNIQTTAINGKNITEYQDTLGALEKVTIEGIITDDNGVIQSDYNGIVYPTIFDKKSTLTTLENDPDSNPREYETYKNVLFKGAASVTNGEFSFTFVIPKDIDYSFGAGRISYYAQNDQNIDAGGFLDSIMIGGTSTNIISDNQGPDIQIFMNDESWVYGGTTNSEPELLLKLEDENGINVAGTSIGHDLSGTLDDDNQGTFIMNDYYEAEVDNFQKGIARYPLTDLESGRHSISIKAWDVLNNSSEARSEFVVIADGDNILKHVLNYPNPFTTSTNFQFEHDLVNSDLDILVTIYTISGKIIKTIEATQYASGFRIDDIHWDGKDDFGSDIGKGVYLYKIKVRSDELNLVRESDFEKLVILH